MSTPRSKEQNEPAAGTSGKFVINLFGGPDDEAVDESEPLSYLDEEQEHEMTEEQLGEEGQQAVDGDQGAYAGHADLMQEHGGDEEQQAPIVVDYAEDEAGSRPGEEEEEAGGSEVGHLSVAQPTIAADRKISIQLFENSQEQVEQESHVDNRKISIQLFADDNQSESQNNSGIEKTVGI